MTLDLDPDRCLALAYVPPSRRPAMEALWRLDVTLGSVLAGGRDPMIGRIRLAWWREALERLDGAPPPAEPLLRAVAERLVPGGIGGGELAAMEEGWSLLLSEGPLDAGQLRDYAEARGGALFRHSARLLGRSGAGIAAAGAQWALVDLARRSANRGEAADALEAAAGWEGPLSWPRALRPLGMLSVLARRDLRRGSGAWEAQGSPTRMARMFRHFVTGR